MRERKAEVWAKFAKTWKSGAVKAFDVVANGGPPRVVSPLFWVDEITKIRIVHSLKVLNNRFDPDTFSVKLDDIYKARDDILTPGAYLSTADWSSAYNHVRMRECTHTLLGLCIRANEMPDEVTKMLRTAAKEGKMPSNEINGKFYWCYTVVNFGMAPSAMIFCTFSQSCAHVWRPIHENDVPSTTWR